MDVRNRIRDNHSARSMTKIIHCEEIAPDPVTITLGNIRIDATRISAYNTIRMLKLTQRRRSLCEQTPGKLSATSAKNNTSAHRMTNS